MAEGIVCLLCNKRRARRACPAVKGGICAICCGEQREVSLTCPLDCEYLREARKHEKPVEIPVDAISNPDIGITEEFVQAHQELLLYLVHSLLTAALRTQSAVDLDILQALDALIRTYKTAQSGLVYETRAENMVAASVQQKFADAMKHHKEEADGDVYKILVFLHRVGQQNLNGRSKGRMFIDMLREMTPITGVDERAPSIIL